ncbi:hypothetical protein Fmac_030343 [Flemingia macrophylla]|uniref:Uncharacterized protein n=1 Tax=Flemingia macrophylla TaxID=520843 RepID=A0ABD1LCW5_9FABA
MEVTSLVPLVGECYTLKLKHSMQDLMAEISKESPDFSPFVDAFYELMQAKVDAPFEVIWVYAAINLRGHNSEKGDALDRVLAAKDLFQLLSGCSASVCGSKSIALMAPVVFAVYGVIVELFGRELRLKREKKVMREVKSLVDVVLGYIGICCDKKTCEEEPDSVSVPFTDLARVWVDMNDDGFESLLPLVSRDVCDWLCSREFHVGYLAGAVIMEAFFLKLCLSFHFPTSRDELGKSLKSWAVGSISCFQNIYFLGQDPYEDSIRDSFASELNTGICSHFRCTKVRYHNFMAKGYPLHNPALHRLTLKPEDEILSREVLFDAILLVEYPFLYLNGMYIKGLTLTRLIVTHEAVEYFRGLGDQNRAVSYIKAFSASRMPLQIIKWATSHNRLEEKTDIENGSPPKVLINWLLSLENRGIRIFEDDVLKSHATSGLDISQAELPSDNLEGKIADDDLFYVDNIGEEGNTVDDDKQNKLISDAFVAAAQTMKLSDNGAPKRKGKHSGKKIKFVKYDLHQNSEAVKARTSAADDSSSGESEIDDPVSDADA